MDPPTGNNWQKTNVFPDTTGKSDTSEDQKGITSGTLFPVGSSFISELSVFRAAEKQSHGEQG